VFQFLEKEKHNKNILCFEGNKIKALYLGEEVALLRLLMHQCQPPLDEGATKIVSLLFVGKF